MKLFFPRAYVDGRIRSDVLVTADASGTITAVECGTSSAPEPAASVPAAPGTSPATSPGSPTGTSSEDIHVFTGTAFPGAHNAHSHAFHRLLRGRTHDDGGTFWTWRQEMYAAAASLTPQLYREVATAVFGEMIEAGYTSVGEFHYVHHAPDGTAYPDHAMERALAEAAATAGIRLVLLDTCYLQGGIGKELAPEQARFGDGSIGGYMRRHASLREALADFSPLVTVGAAIHSVRAVAAEDLPRFADLDGPLHIHLSEQPAENEQALAAYGKTPTQLLAEAGLLSPRLSAVHATHLNDEDIRLLGDAGVHIVMCPTTEADLADGIGPARALADAGAVICLGSDQHVVLDSMRELQALEAGERLASGQRGRFSPAELITALTQSGASALGLRSGIAVGCPADIVTVEHGSVRTAGSRGEQVVMSATAADISAVIVAGRVRRSRPKSAEQDPLGRLYTRFFKEE